MPAIKQALMQFYQPCPIGHRERHLNTLAAMICSLADSQRAQLATIADHAPSRAADQESVMARFRRWLTHDAHTLRKLAHIETFFSDQKSRGFHIHKSQLRDPQRLARLLIAACLAYLWLVYLGVCVLRDGWLKRLHRRDRCNPSLFRLGVQLLARCLKDDIPIPRGFLVPAILPGKPVRQLVQHMVRVCELGILRSSF
jgi:hypothetical protein